tara:strand:+ start:2700 stop:6206 length:3507 start_codon:yes stop_codon:yes gene_type:complete
MSEDMSDEYFSITRKLNILETSIGINTEQINFLNKNLNKLVTDGIKVVDEENEQVQIELATGTAAGAGTNGLTEVNFSPHWANHLANIPAGGGGTGTNSLATGTAAGAVANGLTEVNFTPTLATKLNGIEDNANFKTIGDGGLTENNFTNALKNKLDGISIGANVGILSLSQDNSPTLGADLDVSTFGIKSSSNRNIEISPNGSGIVKIKGNTGGSGQIQLNCEDNSHGVKIKGPPHSAGASYTLTLPDDDGTADQVLKTDGSGNLSWTTQSSGGGGGGGILSLSQDNSPTLGADLDVSTFSIKSISNRNIQISPNGTGEIVLDGEVELRGHIIPDTNAAYDLGNAEHKIRHLFLSDNSLWIGDKHKLSVEGGEMKFKKRKINTIPKSIQAYEDNASAIISWMNSNNTSSNSINNLSDIPLEMWLAYGKTVGVNTIEAIYGTDTDDFDEDVGLSSISVAAAGGGGGGGGGHIAPDTTTAASYTPSNAALGGALTYSEPGESLKLDGNLRLEKDPNVAASGSLIVEDQLVIRTDSTESSSDFNDLYRFSGFNHPLSPAVQAFNEQWGATNIILGDTNKIISNKTTDIETVEKIEMKIRDGPFNDPHALITISGPNTTEETQIKFLSDNKVVTYVGETDGSSSLPGGGTGRFSYLINVGGYSSTDGIQQDGNLSCYAGSQILLASPEIVIGSTGYGFNPSFPIANSTNYVILKANTRVDIQTPELRCEGDVDIKGALLTNGDAGNAGYVLTSGGGNGNAMTWMPGLFAWNDGVNASFRSTQLIDMMGDTIVVGATNGGWYPTANPHPNPGGYYWNLSSLGFSKDSIDNGQNYTRRIHNNSQDIFISSFPNPSWSHTTDYTFIPDNRIHLSARHYQTNGKPEIILETDKDETDVNITPGLNNYPGQPPNGGCFPKIRICAGKWSGLHELDPLTQTQNAGFLHMSAGNSAALLSKRIYIGKQKDQPIDPSPLHLVHNGYGPEFNTIRPPAAFQDAFDPGEGQSGTQILSLSADNIEIVSGNTVQIWGQVSANQQILNSDDRLKHNEEDLTNSLDVIRKLKPQKYQKTKTFKKADFNGTLEEGSYINESGFIAQDILNVPELAYCVSGGDFTKTSKDSEGVEKEVIIEKPYSVNYIDIFTRNVSATQELDTIVTNLLTKIATLEARITELENK